MTQEQRQQELYTVITNKASGTAAPVNLNWYSVYFYVSHFTGDREQGEAVADWVMNDAQPGEAKETDTYKIEIKSYTEKQRLLFANGTKDNHAEGICLNSTNAQQHLEEFRSIFHKREDYTILDEGKDYITVHFPYDGLFADGIRTYYIN